MNPILIRRTCDLAGTVQGVGFRPALYRLARAAGLGGWAQNRSGTVRLVLEGSPTALDAFLAGLPRQLPPHATISELTLLGDEPLPPGTPPSEFSIRTSDAADEVGLVIPPDLCMCEDCRRDVFEPSNRRHGYAFTTCTRCGPRFTVVEAMPYDRERTTLSRFPMCAACRAEYDNPADRRFHAESIACPACGPRLRLSDQHGTLLPGDPLRCARRLLADGRVVAVRGLGGFLLAVDARNRDALALLRQRKARPDRPFAVMARDLSVAHRLCHVPPAAEAMLRSPEAPIVILDLRTAPAAAPPWPLDLLCPDSDTLGVMLPTTPLHALLATPLADDPTPAFDLLVMTSGNRRGEPICISNHEAFDRLQGVADYLLTHDREINLRNDDSVCVVQAGQPQVWRRARGYAPNAVTLTSPLPRRVLALGAELKNAVAVAFDRTVVLSPHVGDLETPEACEALERTARELPRFLNRPPDVIAVDQHPDMHATRHGERLAAASGLPLVRVQHHHAHAAAALAEHGLDHGLVLVFDGTGLGPDGTIWGAELLELETARYRRLATFKAVPLPGGDAAVRHPVRQLVARWTDAGITPGPELLRSYGLDEPSVAAWRLQSLRGLQSPLTHAAGRLFDAVAAALGSAPARVTYEGQAPICLEAAARRASRSPTPPAASLPFDAAEQDGLLEIDWAPLFRRLAEPSPFAGSETAWALPFHQAVAEAAVRMVTYALDCSTERIVALSGGVFMNRLLTEILIPRLANLGVSVLTHRTVPPNDGCIALGQAVIAGRLQEP